LWSFLLIKSLELPWHAHLRSWTEVSLWWHKLIRVHTSLVELLLLLLILLHHHVWIHLHLLSVHHVWVHHVWVVSLILLRVLLLSWISETILLVLSFLVITSKACSEIVGVESLIAVIVHI
jgi:hypothetical protein